MQEEVKMELENLMQDAIVKFEEKVTEEEKQTAQQRNELQQLI